ncbi:hypothetical protein CCAN11_2230010 [Capnocytophaga canimorsus]|uniref:Uncharacterized protein n=1 Tax=Capnocytophaga canimorsus TaxID=28188 RepID=A0A0B7ILU3_9FLAO|nr:hypothetical protein [Capnocytophaga canimorsus]CEN50977.1 hypothetical protein CCAN11_2230010 [Capnocytophaga canimorsus]
MTALFKQIGDVAMNILGSVGDLIVGVFTLDIDKIKSALGKGFDAIKGAVTQPKAIIGGAINGWNKELSKPIDKEVTISPKTGPKDNDNPINLTPNGTPKGWRGHCTNQHVHQQPCANPYIYAFTTCFLGVFL